MSGGRRAGELAHVDEGDPEDPPIVLLHGSTDDPWGDVRSMLSPWMRVIAPEPGGDAIAPSEMADRVRSLLEALGVRRFAVAGEGDGGRVAQHLAFEGKVEAMVLIGSPSLEGVDDRLASLEVPVLVVYGEDDPELPATKLAERFAELLPMASVALLPGRGHALLEEAPGTVAPLMFQWLRSRYLKVEHSHEGGPVVVQLGREPKEER